MGVDHYRDTEGDAEERTVWAATRTASTPSFGDAMDDPAPSGS